MPLLDSKILERNSKINSVFKNKLQDNKDMLQEYLSYRGITESLIDTFQIGYCPKNLKLPDHLKRMAGRIIFPIFSEYNDLVAFSGRFPIEKDELPEGEKHWFHESFPKSHFLYGLNVARESIVKADCVFVVEGQVDQIMMYKYGFHNTISVLGSSLVPESISKIARYTNRIITIFDNDSSGNKSSERTFNFLKDYASSYTHVNVELKNAKDPDEYLNKFGAKKLLALISKYVDNKTRNWKDQKYEVTI